MDKHKCLRCGHQWVKRIDNPRMCPRCKSLYWNYSGLGQIPSEAIIKEEIKERPTETIGLHKPETL